MKKFLLAGAAALSLAGVSHAQTYLIGGVGYEQLAFDGFTYDLNANVLGSLTGLYTDTTPAGDSSAVYPSPFVARASVYFDGSHLSSVWQGESNLVGAGTVGGLTNTSTTGELLNTTRRTTVGDTLYGKGLDTEGIFTFANPDAQVDRAIGFNIASGSSFSYVLDTTGYQLNTLQLTGFMAAGSSALINWSYSLDGSTLVSTGLSTSITGTLAAVYSVDFSSLGLSNDSDLVIVGTFAGNEGNTVALDNTAFIGTAAVIPEPSTYAALLGAATIGFVVIRRRKAAVA